MGKSSNINKEVLAAVGKTREEFESFGDGSDIDVSLVDSVDAAIQRHVEGPEHDGESERHKSRIGVYHASGAAKCIRKRWYSHKNVVKQDWDGFPKGIAFRGNLVEDEVEDALEKHLRDYISEGIDDGIVVDNEYPVSVKVDEYEGVPEFYITGSTDPFIKDSNGEVIEIVEVKSSNNPPEEPSWYHKFQLNTYLSAVGLDTGIIVYIDPSNWDNRKVFRYEQEPERWELTKLFHAVFHWHLVNDKLPPRTPMGEDECKMCSYKGLCIRNDDGEQYTKENYPPNDHMQHEERSNIFKRT